MSTKVVTYCDVCKEELKPQTFEQVTVRVRTLDVCAECQPKTTVKELLEIAEPKEPEPFDDASEG